MNRYRTMAELENDMIKNDVTKWANACERAIEAGRKNDANAFAQAAVRAARKLDEYPALMRQAEQVAEPMLRLINSNEILITPSARGYHVTFPYKPEPSAIRGFHGIINEAGEQMHWDNTGTSVYWFIPEGNTKAIGMRDSEDCLKLAMEMINYWFDAKRQPGKAAYRARLAEQNTAETVRWNNEQFTQEAKAAGGVLVIKREAA